MSELLDFSKRVSIPPYEDLTFEVLRVSSTQSLLVKIVNTLSHHSTIQSTLLSSLTDECKIRPTYSEIIEFIAKRAEPELVEKTYVDLTVIHNVSNDLEHKFQTASQTHKEQVEDYKHEFKNFQHLAMENFHRLFHKINKHSEERKSVVKLYRRLRKQLLEKRRVLSMFQGWKKIAMNKQKSRKKLKKIFKRDERRRVEKGWNKLKGAYLLTRMKKFEGKSVQALLRADDCQDKLLELLPEVYLLKRDKASNTDLTKLESAVMRINYQSVFKDLTSMITEEAVRLKNDVEGFHRGIKKQLQDYEANVKSLEFALKNHDSYREINTIKSQISSLGNMHLLLNERISRIDYCNKKEDNEFKLEVMMKQLQNLESKVLSISNSQETIQDHSNYLKSILETNSKQGSKGSVRMYSAMTTRAGESNMVVTPQNAELDLSVSGVYLKQGKRVASASAGKQRIYQQRRRHNIPTSFSSTLTITDTPTHMAFRVT
jgi:hypothetical protein